MVIFLSKKFDLLFFIILLILSNKLSLQQTWPKDFYSNKNCKAILIEQKIIFIQNNENDNNIYYYDLTNLNERKHSGDYGSSIRTNKNIIKIEGNRFMIFGVNNNDNKFCYRTYSFFNTNSYEEGGCLDLGFTNSIIQLDAKYVSQSKVILSTLVNSQFGVYLIDYKNNNDKKSYLIEDNNNNFNIGLFTRINIQCDSSDAINFLCIFSYNFVNEWKLFYLRGSFESPGNANLGNICNNECFLGNIIKTNNSKNKFLVCYQKEAGSLLTIVCQYFSYENNNILIDNDKDIARVVAVSLNEPLILYIYDNSILIQVDTKSTNNKNLMVILSSFDLNINTQINLISGQGTVNFKTISLINTDNYIYIIYEDGSSTKITGQEIYECINDNSITSNDNSITLSFNQKKEADFKNRHNGHVIGFSLDSNINLYKADDETSNSYSIVSSNSYISLENESKRFFFGRKDSSGVFQNYYCYLSDGADGFYQFFSLICPITITICYSSCQTCIPNEISTNENHLCLSCTSGFNAKKSEFNSKGYNCYKNSDQRLSNYYLNTNDGFYYKCNDVCKTCGNAESCKTCNNGYYFISSNSIDINYGLCQAGISNDYYLDYNANIQYEGVINYAVYKPCYDTCFSCDGKGTYENNNCKTCKKGKKYPYNDGQCTTDKQYCLDNKQYWEFNNNNIECISNCEKKIILYGDNKGQCVDDCKNYFNPYSKITNYFTLINCEGKNYCIPFETCLNGKFEVYLEESECERLGSCEIDVFSNIDPFEHDNDPIPTIIDDKTDEIMTKEEKINEINKRFKVLKMFTNDSNYTNFKKFDLFLIRDYIKLLNKELENYNNNSEIYLITNTKYENFTITLYPLDIEDFVYEQILSPNNLGFVNFTKAYSNFIEYEIDNKCLILVILLESLLTNSSINDLNYYLYSFDEKKDTGSLRNQIKIEQQISYLSNNNTQLEILYPLYNYYDQNSDINERNSKILVDNIKTMNYKYPNIELYNLSDPFYNDICNLFTTEVNTDMTLNDRRNEYYINISLCENDCFLIKVLNKELKYPKSLCSCNIKAEYISSNQSGVRDYIPQKSSYNIKSFLCIKETFNKNSISSNVIFWIFLIVILFLIIMLIRWFFYGNKEIKRILNLYKENPDESKMHISIQSNEDIELIKNNSISKNNNNSLSKNNNNSKKNEKNNSKNKEKNNAKVDKKKDLAKSMALPDKKGKRYSNNQIESQQLEYLSAPINQSAPPKKKEVKQVPSIATKDEYKNDDKDLISNSEPSFFKASIIKPNEKDNVTDISFENYPSDDQNQIYIDNLVKQKKMLENNYLQNPVEYEKFQKMEIMRKALYSPEDLELKKFCNSCEDIHFSKNYKENDGINKNKVGDGEKNKKNNKITKLLGGESLFDDENNSNNNNLSDNNDQNKLNNFKNNNNDNFENNANNSLFKIEKDFEGNEQFFFPDGIYGKDKKNSLIDGDNTETLNGKNYKNKKNQNKKKKGKKLFEDNEEDKNNGNESDKRIKKKKYKGVSSKKKDDYSTNINARNRLLKSIGGSNFENDNEEKKDGKDENKINEKLKTEYDIDANNKIKSELKKIANGDDDPNSIGGIFNRRNNNTINSNDSDFNNLIKTHNSNILKLKAKNNLSKDNNKHNKNDSSREINSNRRMLHFKEDGFNSGNMGIPNSDEKRNNNENEISDIINNEKNSKNNKSDFEMLKDKILASSVSAFLESEGNKPILVEENFFLFYWRYFQKRELCLVCFRDRKDTIPYFVRWSTFVFCLVFIFLLNCLFFFEKSVHKRYINALNGKKNSIGYYFKNEYIMSFYIALISCVFKMIIIKLVLYKLFKIRKETKKMMTNSAEKGLDPIQLEELINKRNKFSKIYKIKLVIFFILLMIFSIFFAYICICYAGVFRNSISAFLYGFLFSFITSFILCALFCLIIVGIYKISKSLKNKCLLSTYVVLSTMY